LSDAARLSCLVHEGYVNADLYLCVPLHLIVHQPSPDGLNLLRVMAGMLSVTCLLSLSRILSV
jgi:hypothetical protein